MDRLIELMIDRHTSHTDDFHSLLFLFSMKKEVETDKGYIYIYILLTCTTSLKVKTKKWIVFSYFACCLLTIVEARVEV